MSLSKREKIAVGIVSASVGIAALGAAINMIQKRSRIYNAHHDYSDDEEEDYEQHLKFLKRKGSDSNSSHSISSSRDLNVFNSSRLNSDTSFQDDSEMHDLSAAQLLPDNVHFVNYKQVLDLLKLRKKREYVMFDLREIDYKGGHIAGSVNISDKTFYDEIPGILEKYHGSSMVILQCMDGSLRSIENIEFLAKARNEVIKNYDAKTKTSYYYQYKLKIQHSAHKTMMRSIHWDNELWMKRFVEIKKVVIDLTKHEDMYRNIREQQYFVIAGGFFEFINSLINDKEFEINSLQFHSVIADFNMAHWEQLNIMGEKKIYHRTEYYTTRRLNPLRKTQTKREF